MPSERSERRNELGCVLAGGLEEAPVIKVSQDQSRNLTRHFLSDERRSSALELEIATPTKRPKITCAWETLPRLFFAWCF